MKMTIMQTREPPNLSVEVVHPRLTRTKHQRPKIVAITLYRPNNTDEYGQFELRWFLLAVVVMSFKHILQARNTRRFLV